MTKYLVTLLGFIIGTPIHAEEIPLVPPSEYAHPYMEGPTNIFLYHKSTVWAECEAALPYSFPHNLAGCARVENNTCIVIIATKSPRAPMDEIITHEIAHCNGWSH